MKEQWRSRITIEPGKRGGRPCIRGMRITVYDVLSYLAAGMTVAEKSSAQVSFSQLFSSTSGHHLLRELIALAVTTAALVLALVWRRAWSIVLLGIAAADSPIPATRRPSLAMVMKTSNMPSGRRRQWIIPIISAPGPPNSVPRRRRSRRPRSRANSRNSRPSVSTSRRSSKIAKPLDERRQRSQPPNIFFRLSNPAW